MAGIVDNGRLTVHRADTEILHEHPSHPFRQWPPQGPRAWYSLRRHAPATPMPLPTCRGLRWAYCTIIEGEGKLVPGNGPIRTGVTAILPAGPRRFRRALCCGVFQLQRQWRNDGPRLDRGSRRVANPPSPSPTPIPAVRRGMRPCAGCMSVAFHHPRIGALPWRLKPLMAS